MRKQNLILTGTLALLLLISSRVSAHTPLCACYDNGDGTITCEGGFSDGSSAAGVGMRIENTGGDILLNGKMDADSEFSFSKPADTYRVIFDAGEGHVIEIQGSDILE